MPKDSSSNDEILSKAVGSAVGWTIGASALPFYYLAKWVWRGLVFTGLWPLLVLIFLFGFYPSPDLSFPILFAFLFSIFWTGKNLVGLTKTPPVSTKKFNGVFFGANRGQHKDPVGKTIDKDGHILVVGGAGSGKSAYVAIPTLRYFWDGRFLAVDIKGELAQKSGRKAAIFNPCNPDALGYDPFYFARNLPNPTAQMREIALTLVPKSPDIKDPFWIQAAQNILTGHLLVAHKNGAPFINALKKIQGVPPQRLLEIAAADERAAMFVMQYIDTKKETLAGIMSELSNHIIPFIGDPDLEASLTKENIITPNLLEEGNSIFLQIPEHRINQWKALITLVIQQFLTHFEQRPENNDAPILFLIDEFARFGKIEGIVDGLATLRSKKITICILIQSLAQLDALYGQEYRKIIADNCAYKVVLSATDADTQQYFSLLAGTELVTQESFTKDQKNLPWFGGPETISSTVSKVERAVIKPEAFAQLGIMNTVVVFSPAGMQTYIKQRYDKILGREPLV